MLSSRLLPSSVSHSAQSNPLQRIYRLTNRQGSPQGGLCCVMPFVAFMCIPLSNCFDAMRGFVDYGKQSILCVYYRIIYVNNYFADRVNDFDFWPGKGVKQTKRAVPFILASVQTVLNCSPELSGLESKAVWTGKIVPAFLQDPLCAFPRCLAVEFR